MRYLPARSSPLSKENNTDGVTCVFPEIFRAQRLSQQFQSRMIERNRHTFQLSGYVQITGTMADPVDNPLERPSTGQQNLVSELARQYFSFAHPIQKLDFQLSLSPAQVAYQTAEIQAKINGVGSKYDSLQKKGRVKENRSPLNQKPREPV